MAETKSARALSKAEQMLQEIEGIVLAGPDEEGHYDLVSRVKKIKAIVGSLHKKKGLVSNRKALSRERKIAQWKLRLIRDAFRGRDRDLVNSQQNNYWLFLSIHCDLMRGRETSAEQKLREIDMIFEAKGDWDEGEWPLSDRLGYIRAVVERSPEEVDDNDYEDNEE